MVFAIFQWTNLTQSEKKHWPKLFNFEIFKIKINQFFGLKLITCFENSISTSNQMFGRVIWNTLPECQKLLEPNIWLPVSHTKPIDTLYWNQYLLPTGNYKSARGELQNSGWLQINTVNGAMSITVNRVINQVMMISQTCLKILCFHKSKFWKLANWTFISFKTCILLYHII